MKLFKNGVGRPSNEVKAKRRNITVLIIVISLVVIGAIGFFIYNYFSGIGGVYKNAEANRFTVADNSNNCYTVTAPSNATNWRVQVYYKSKTALSYGKNKIISKDHYSDNVKSEKICFSKQKYDSETFRILVKWTTGSNDKAYTKVRGSSWKPSGWTYNILTGWAQKDYNVKWNTSTGSSITPPSGLGVSYEDKTAVRVKAGEYNVTELKNYYPTITIKNTTGNKYFYRWFTFDQHNPSKDPSWNKGSCIPFTSTLTITNLGLAVDVNLDKRMGLIKVYSDESVCKNDNNSHSTNSILTTSTVKYTLLRPTISVKYNNSSVNNNGVVNLSKTGDYYSTYTLKGADSNTRYWYKFFTYEATDITKTPTYPKVGTNTCGSFTGTKTTSSWGATMSNEYPDRKVQARIYPTEQACIADTVSLGTKVLASHVLEYKVNNIVSIKQTTAIAPKDGVITVNKYDKYIITYKINNTTSSKKYYRWFTWGGLNFDGGLTYNGSNLSGLCSGFSGVLYSPVALVTSSSNPNRSGIMKVYSSYNSCKNDTNGTNNKDVLVKSPVKIKMGLTKVVNGFVQIANYDYTNIKNKIGKQAPAKCDDYARAYGLYILTGKVQVSSSGIGAVCGTSVYKAGYSNLYSYIVSQINKGIPVILHFYNNYSPYFEHWTTVVGYKDGKTSVSNDENNFKNNLWGIDPYNCNEGKLGSFSTLTTIKEYNAFTWASMDESLKCK